MSAAQVASSFSRPATLITGTAKRIGRVIALELARAGHDLALHARTDSAELQQTLAEVRALGASAVPVLADLADEAACRQVVPAAIHTLGRLDNVVNNASRFAHDTASDVTPERMDWHWRANTAAPILLAQALAAHRQHLPSDPLRPSACVVNLLDQKLWNPNPDHFSYTLSKAALREATVLLAQALAPLVRVVGVAPGITLPSGPMTEAEFAAAHRLTPLGRSSSAEDIARSVRFLLESPAITGTTLLVDGGQHLSAQDRDVFFLVNGSGPRT